MDTSILHITLEVLGFCLVLLLAGLITWPLGRRCRGENIASLSAGRVMLHVLARLSLPSAVLALSFLGGLALEQFPQVADFAARNTWYRLHQRAWMMFWGILLCMTFVESLVVLLYRLRGRPFPVPGLLLNIARVLVVILAVFLVLRFLLDVNVSPLLGASALVTAVLGFALQGVLGNLLAGMSLHVVRSMMPGDWVSIDGTEGEVTHTNWRETRLRTVGGHVIIVPNSIVSSVKIHNMTRPTPLRRHSIPVGASYSDAPAEVIEALVESALSVPDVLREPAPKAFITEYKDFGINYTLWFSTNRYFARIPVEGDVMRMIWYQFKRRGIEIPFPMSDKLLNDFMAVVYRQRHLPPEEIDVERNHGDLLRSEFVSKLLVDSQGTPMLKDEELRGLARSVQRVRYTRGETVFRQGEPGEACYVVVRGHVHARIEYQDTAQNHEFDLGPGALFGEMSLVTGLPRTATMLANEEVELLEIGKETFTQLLELRADIPRIMADLAGQRAEHNQAMLEKLRAMGNAQVADSLKSGSILKRFLRMLGRAKK
jgi:small-conductance mechanosensitive channel/CRP-like cAMP-binding protein